jgi:glutathione synthase/RimK-type ligase-like ATP-grasp enzyme
MNALFVVDAGDEWRQAVPGASVATAKEYLAGTPANAGFDRVVNLCRFDGVNGQAYYVSLLAEARGQHPLPAARTLQDVSGSAGAPFLDEVGKRMQGALAGLPTSAFALDAYFGMDPAGGHASVARELFRALGLPLARAEFRWERGRWRLAAVRPLGLCEVPSAHAETLRQSAARFLSGKAERQAYRHRGGQRPAIAILHTPSEPMPPSNPPALRKLLRAAGELGMHAEIIDRDSIERLEEFEALFIRDTTYLDHYTYRFSQRAVALGMVVIEDPDSILQCNNKVYLGELLPRHGIPVPRTLMVHRDNLGEVAATLGLPCVLKRPDGGFSLGVRKAHSEAELRRLAAEMLEKSELIIAQEFLPTAFDWRVTVLDRRVLFVCKYYMAPQHWQVHKYEPGHHVEGASEALSVGEAPRNVVEAALRAANLIGEGLYGVDLKQVGTQCYVIEVNDNPNIDAGIEDGLLKDALYREVMGVFLRRISERRSRYASDTPEILASP